MRGKRSTFTKTAALRLLSCSRERFGRGVREWEIDIVMDEETLWVLKMLSARKISARSADRLLQGLDLLRKYEASKQASSAVSPLTTGEKSPAGATQTSVEAEVGRVATETHEAEEEASLSAEQGRAVELQEVEEATNIPEITQAAADKGLVIAEEEEQKGAVTSGDVQPPAEADQVSPEEREATGEVTQEDAQDTEKSPSKGSMWTETIDGTGIIDDIPDGAELTIEKVAGNVKICGWEQPHVEVEGEGCTATVLQDGRILNIEGDNDLALHVPRAIGRISVAIGSGSVCIEKHPNNISIDSDTADTNIREASGIIRASSIEGGMMLEDCCGEVSLESKSGDICFRKTLNAGAEDFDVTLTSSETADAPPENERADDGILEVTRLDIRTASGNIMVAGAGGDMDVQSGGGNITVEHCSGQNIRVKSSGGSLVLRDVVDNVYLGSYGGSIEVVGFSGTVRIEAEASDVSLKNSGDAEIYIESNNGNISVEDCCADLYVNSGTGNVHVSGDNLSSGGMGKVELKMRSGDADLHCRTLEDFRIAMEDGNAELNVERLTSGGAGRISVYRGNITTRVPLNFQCEVTIHAPGKKAYVELPIQVIDKDKNLLRGTLNGGGSKIQLIAPNGEIRFQPLKLPLHRLREAKR